MRLSDEMSFVIRPARAADKEAVLAFCTHTFHWGDYLPLVWDDWLADEVGALLVATHNDAPVGVAKVTLLAPTEAWLEGLRVHEAYRRRGLAWQFLIRCLEVARQRGAQVARLMTSSKNIAVHKTTERAGMRHVASALSLLAQALPPAAGSAPLVPLTVRDWPEVSARIIHGTALAEMGGLYGAAWAWQALTEAKLRAHLEHGQVWALQDSSGGVVATAIVSDVDQHEETLPVAYVDGAPSDAEALAAALRRHGASLQAEKVEVMLASGSPLRDAFLKTGYEREMEGEAGIWIYELDWKGAAS